MNKLYLTVLLILATTAICTIANADPTLHPFFAQNGDCYLLIGNGPHRGVYALNNLTTGKNKWLYDPYDAYGLVAAQSYDAKAIQKWLYTFASTESGWEAFTGMAERRVVDNASWNKYAPSVVPPYIVHRYHGSPFDRQPSEAHP
jgi:hypothetical protein